MKHILAVLVENHAGVLSKVSGLFSRRGFNIDSLAVGPTDDAKLSRMTIVVDADEGFIEQVTKQLNKLIDVIKVVDITQDSIARELILVKVHASAAKRKDIIELALVYQATIIHVTKQSITLSLSDQPRRLQNFLDIMREFGIKEIVRTGVVAVEYADNQ